MPYPNDRRKNADDLVDEALSPEFLAMLLACGGEVREGDRAVLREVSTDRRAGRRRSDPPSSGSEQTA
ncbi:MAG: hypothetical protein ABI699_05205 [Caldimonas sp.]